MNKPITILLIVAIISIFHACSTDEKECNIIGKWQVNEAIVESATMPRSLKETVRSGYIKATYSFNENGSMSILYPSSQKNDFTYNHDKVANEIRFKPPANEKEDVLKVGHCSVDTLKVQQPFPANGTQEEESGIALTLVRSK